jgi:short-subunit dehydrogenase
VARSEVVLKELAGQTGARPVVADLTDGDQVAGLVSRIESAGGPIDVLVNNAAVCWVGPFWKMSGEELDENLTLNIKTPLELARQVLPGMIARSLGTVVNISSFAAFAVMPTIAPYVTSKAALTHFTAALQRELRGSSVRAMIVQLGEVAGTDLVENARRSPPIALASRRLDRFHVLCQMSLASVAAGIADAIAAGRPSVVMPRRVAPLHHLRDLPNRMNDLLLAGRESMLDFSAP